MPQPGDRRSRRVRTGLAAIAAAIAVLLAALVAWWSSDGPAHIGADDGSVSAGHGRRALPAPPGLGDPGEDPATPDAARAAAAQPPADDPHAEDLPKSSARCRISPALADAAGHLAIGPGAEPPYDGRIVSVADGWATLPIVEGSGVGVLAIDGYAPLTVSWTGGTDTTPGRCAPDPLVLEPGAAWIVGKVRNAEGEPEGKVFVEGCGNRATTDADGTYAMTVLAGEACTVGAFRRDGLLVGKADPAEVTPKPGETVVDFVLPEVPTGGLGLVIDFGDDGVRILDVLPGTAAEEAELTEGDVVVEVDGVSTAGMDLDTFVDLAVGPLGSEVDVVVVRGGEPRHLRLDRRELRGG